MPTQEAETARERIVVRRLSIDPGEWNWDTPDPAVGYLVLGGLLARGLQIDGSPARGLDLVGERDLLRPRSFAPELRSIPIAVDWTALTTIELAILDATFKKAMRAWPTLAINLMMTLNERIWSASSLLAAHHVNRLDGRILASLWMIADRWGRVGAEGVTLELPKLTHEMLARLVAARRPSVTTSLRRLRSLELVEQRKPGLWILRGDPSEALRRVAGTQPEPDASSTDEWSAD